MNIGFTFEPELFNSDYRVILPMRALERRGHKVIWPSHGSKDARLRELSNCDLVHWYRRVDRVADLNRLYQGGVAISFDNDDDVGATDMNEGTSSLRGLLQNRKRSAAMTAIARMADLVTTPSQVLAAKYRTAGAHRVVVIENYLDRDMFGFGTQSKHEGLVIGWVANLEHAADLSRLKIVDALTRLLDVHSNLRVLSVGIRLPLRSDRYEHIPFVQHEDLLKVIGRIDIGIAPLADTPFNRSRSNVKLKEYGAGRAAWLASPVGPYLGLGAAEGGLLVGDDDWFEALDELVRSPVKRRRLARRALKWAKGQTTDRFVSALENEFQLAIEHAEERTASLRKGRGTGGRKSEAGASPASLRM